MPSAKCTNHKVPAYFDWKGRPRVRDAICPLCFAQLERTALSLVKRKTLNVRLFKEHPLGRVTTKTQGRT